MPNGTAEVWINEDEPPKLVISAPYFPEFIIDLRNRKIVRVWDKEAKVYKFDLSYTKEVVDCLHHHFREVIKTPSVGMYYLLSFLDTSDIEDVYKVLARKHRDGDMRKLLDSLFGRFWQLEKIMDTPKFRQFRFCDDESDRAETEMDAFGGVSEEIQQMMVRRPVVVTPYAEPEPEPTINQRALERAMRDIRDIAGYAGPYDGFTGPQGITGATGATGAPVATGATGAPVALDAYTEFEDQEPRRGRGRRIAPSPARSRVPRDPTT
jgi:hypothetical protein